MHRILITALLLTSMHATIAMQQLRNAICKKPVTSVVVTASLASVATLSITRPDILKRNPIHEFKQQQIRREIAQQQALPNKTPEFMR